MNLCQKQIPSNNPPNGQATSLGIASSIEILCVKVCVARWLYVFDVPVMAHRGFWVAGARVSPRAWRSAREVQPWSWILYEAENACVSILSMFGKGGV